MNTTKTYDGQTARFLASVATCVPPLSSDVMQVWIDNPTGFKKFLSNLDSPESSKPSVLKMINSNVFLGAIAAYDPSTLKTRKGVWVSDEFALCVRSKAKPVKNLGPLSLSSHELIKNAYDREITPDLGKNYLRFDESELCARIDQMTSKQPNGDAGDLINNGHANLFYVADYIVRVRWYVDDRGWDVRAWQLGDDYWSSGDRVFSRN